MWEPLIDGLNIVFSLGGLAAMVFGVAVGISVGAMPGLSAAMGVALLIPVTFSMDSSIGLILLGSVYIGAIYGGSISAILISVPGTPASIATSFDGFKMTKNGEADKALKVSISSSFVGGVVGALALIFMAPPLAKIALSFGPDEYFWVAVFGLTIIVSLASENPIKGFISACIGFFVGVIGMDPLIGNTRFTFGNVNLLSGINVVVLLIGLFSVPQALEMIENSGKLNQASSIMKRKKIIRFGEVFKEMKVCVVTLLRSSFLGTLIGIIPGAGANIASYVGYNEAKRWSRTPSKFGTGISEGIAASEAANNAVVGGSLVPLLTLGVPGNMVAAVMIGGLMIHGLSPGPMLFVQDAQIVYSFMGAILFGNFVMLVLGYFASNLFVNVVKIRNNILAPVVLVLSVVGSYALQNSMFDVGLMLAFGVLGYLMKKTNISSAPAVLALILGPMAELNLRRAMQISRTPLVFFSGLIDWILIILTALSLVFAVFVFVRDRKAQHTGAIEQALHSDNE
jgi:putative tricarboxylic transport membrane protein